MHPDHALEQFYTQSHLPGVAALRKMAADMRAEQTYIASSREACGGDDSYTVRWDRIQRVIDYLDLATTPQPTTQFEAWAKLHHYDLTRCSHEPYAAYRSDLTNAALAAWRGANGESAQPDHYQQLLGVAYVVLGCLAANGVDIPVRFLDAFSDPDSVENPLELLPCDFSPAQAVRAAVAQVAPTDEQIEQLWERVTGFRANDERADIAGFARAILGASQ